MKDKTKIKNISLTYYYSPHPGHLSTDGEPSPHDAFLVLKNVFRSARAAIYCQKVDNVKKSSSLGFL